MIVSDFCTACRDYVDNALHFWCNRDHRHLHAPCGHADSRCERRLVGTR